MISPEHAENIVAFFRAIILLGRLYKSGDSLRQTKTRKDRIGLKLTIVFSGVSGNRSFICVRRKRRQKLFYLICE